jgi:hypothetical protein
MVSPPQGWPAALFSKTIFFGTIWLDLAGFGWIWLDFRGGQSKLWSLHILHG